MPIVTNTYLDTRTAWRKRSGGSSGNGTWVSREYTYTLGGTVSKPESRPRSVYLRLLRLHACTTTPLSGDEEFIAASPTYCHNTYRVFASGKWWYIKGELYGAVTMGNPLSSLYAPGDPTLIAYTKAENRAKADYVDSIKAKRRRWQSGVLLGELGKTISGLARPGKALREGIKRWSQIARKRARDAVRSKNGWRLHPEKRRRAVERAISGSYLEWQFGIKPTVMDLDNAMEALAAHNTQTLAWHEPVRGWGLESSETKTVSNTTLAGEGNTVTWDVWRVSTAKVTYTGKIIIAPSHVGLSKRIGLTLEEFAPTIWEIMPWSWLADYFANLGDIIDGLSLCTGDLKWTQRTIWRDSYTETRNLRHSVSAQQYPVDRSFSPGSFEWHRTSFSRSIYGGSLTPSWQFRLPGSGTQWTNMSAVVIQGKAVQSFIQRLVGRR